MQIIKKTAIFSLLVIMAIFYVFCQNKHNSVSIPNSASKTDTLGVYETNLLRNGDIIMRQGNGIVSSVIVANLNEKNKISHCGILNIDNNGINIIHTLSPALSHANGMQQATLHEFISDAYENSIIVVRLKNNDNSKITDKAKYYLSKKIPFDDNFDIYDTTKFFCSELVLRILADECNLNLIDTNTDNAQNLGFSKLLDTTKFDIIINHQNLNKQ
ncbi:MAG: hypothetical protein LBQ28_04060 [Prevotellaceae bacterium]|jgi:hypothetical protein|nr:hypothetical protein [Prevotellaceae bacterium]